MIKLVTLMLLLCGLISLYSAVAKVNIYIQVLAASLKADTLHEIRPFNNLNVLEMGP